MRLPLLSLFAFACPFRLSSGGTWNSGVKWNETEFVPAKEILSKPLLNKYGGTQRNKNFIQQFGDEHEGKGKRLLSELTFSAYSTLMGDMQKELDRNSDSSNHKALCTQLSPQSEDVRQGCYFGLYVCPSDDSVNGFEHCTWYYKQPCGCGNSAFSLEECSIRWVNVNVNHPDDEDVRQMKISVPMGVCQTAFWVVAISFAMGWLFLFFLLLFVRRQVIKNLF
uniref:Uncharacterized protein n=1 Tax=Chromera velia CCMP2878 TaxID=1169474 RepID=A0A0G4FD94_9ALVE|eukprot:Cvel_16439.t1-p1 / transcript=Cvel_16439.t1 / gene=Cvel_16439 / organism=Chromera_velia_CCMP2878 / gene_product=hypothetical protein / transcript_product=hypothetical protein / location=Cvel_scaffold1267:15919-16743(-) / protein_length=222 / sequence_SO=supercontig / SO=protein_coding / is_pseudo=false